MTFEEEEPLEDWEMRKERVFFSFKPIWNKSFEDKQDKLPQWNYPADLHTDLTSSIADIYSDEEYMDSLVFRRFVGWWRSLQWCIVAAHSGMYEAIARELRFILEDLAQALYIDRKLGDSDIRSKTRATSILEDLRLRGTRLIDQVVMEDAKDEMKSLYKVLSDYVHPSLELVQKIHTGDKYYYFTFDESQFQTSLDLYSKASDFILALTISRFPKSIERFILRTGSDDSLESTVASLKKEGYSHTAKVIEEKG